MKQANKPRKVAIYSCVNEQKTDEGDRIVSFYIAYCETHYYFESSYLTYSSAYEDDDLWERPADIAAGFTKYKHSPLLHFMLSDGAVSVSTAPLKKYHDTDVLPPNARNRRRESVSYLLNAALGEYIDRHKDTPDREDLWKLICNDMPNWSVRMLDDRTIAYSKGLTLTKDTYNRQFNRKIGTTSFLNSEFKDMKKFYSEREKKSVGRPRKYPLKKTRKP
jgi:hypothetical protein